MDRSSFSPKDSIAHIWASLGLPERAIRSLDLPMDEECYPSSFKVDHLAQASIGIAALTASLFTSTLHGVEVMRVQVPNEHACVEFKSERLYNLDGKPAPSSWGTIGGLHKTRDGYIRMHDLFPNHRENALRILGLPLNASRDDVAKKMLEWDSVELETKAIEGGAVMAALRSFEEWDAHPQAKAISDDPIQLRRIADHGDSKKAHPDPRPGSRAFTGWRVLEMSRVIAAPVAGRVFAAHGADVLRIVSPTLPDAPDLDIDLNRGKRIGQLDITKEEEKTRLMQLISGADVLIQSYRPGSLAEHGLSTEELIKINPRLIIANLSAYGPEGPWSSRRGFDSLVQTCSGLNVADAEAYGEGEAARVLPCQALDHAAGQFLAAGIGAAFYRRHLEGGSWEVNVSLAGVGKYLRSLGRYEGKTGFDRKDFRSSEDVEKYLEAKQTDLGRLKSVRHSAKAGSEVGYKDGPNPQPTSFPGPRWLYSAAGIWR